MFNLDTILKRIWTFEVQEMLLFVARSKNKVTVKDCQKNAEYIEGSL